MSGCPGWPSIALNRSGSCYHSLDLLLEAKVQHAIVEKVLEKELGASMTKSHLCHQLALGVRASHLGLQFSSSLT